MPWQPSSLPGEGHCRNNNISCGRQFGFGRSVGLAPSSTTPEAEAAPSRCSCIPTVTRWPLRSAEQLGASVGVGAESDPGWAQNIRCQPVRRVRIASSSPIRGACVGQLAEAVGCWPRPCHGVRAKQGEQSAWSPMPRSLCSAGAGG
eukprot:12793742-Alexandrium_andersonii.AAC.1